MNKSQGLARRPSTLAHHPSTTFWLIRHGEIEKRYQNVFGGRIDMKLSPRGHRQAAALARFLHGQRFDAVYVSPMRRVQQTLAPLLRNGLPQPWSCPSSGKWISAIGPA